MHTLYHLCVFVLKWTAFIVEWIGDGGAVDVSYTLTIFKAMLRSSTDLEYKSPKRRRTNRCTYCRLPVYERRCSRPCRRIACCDIPCSCGPTIRASCTLQKWKPPYSATWREPLPQDATRAVSLLPIRAQGQSTHRRTEPSGNEANRGFVLVACNRAGVFARNWTERLARRFSS
jgi:hypothetical protein